MLTFQSVYRFFRKIVKEVNMGLANVTGEATRRGFYIYDDRRKASPDPEIKKYIEKAREMSGVSIDPKVFRQSFPLDS